MFSLKSSEGEAFDVDEAVALEMLTIRHMIELNVSVEGGIRLPNVTSKILPKVIEYCKRHVEAPNPEERSGVRAWEANFVKIHEDILFDLMNAANYLNIQSLLDLTTQTAADMIKHKTPEEIRKTFNIKNDFTPEEEEEVRRENLWAFETEEIRTWWTLALAPIRQTLALTWRALDFIYDIDTPFSDEELRHLLLIRSFADEELRPLLLRGELCG